MIIRARDTAFRVTLVPQGRETIKFRARFRRSGREPPVGIEPTTYALRGRRAVSPALPPALIGHRTPLRAPGYLGERQPRCQNGCQRRRGVPPNPSDLGYASPDSAR